MPPDARERFHSLGFFRPLLALGDMFIAICAGFLAAFVAMLLRPEIGEALWPVSDQYLVPIMLSTILTPGTLNWMGVYRSWRGLALRTELRPLLTGVIGVFLLLVALGVASKTTSLYSRTWMGLWFAFSILGAMGSRIVLRAVLQSLHGHGFDTVTVALLGGGPLATRVAEHLRANPEAGLRAAGYFAVGAGADGPRGLPCLGDLDGLAQSLDRSESPIDQLWIVLPLSAEDTIRKVLHELRHSTVDIRMIPDMFSYHLLNYSSENVVGLPVLNLSYSPLSGSNRYAKELLDRLLAFAILVAISPLMLLIAAAVKISSPGPVIFHQTRHGGDGAPFTVYKFRTMRSHCPAPGVSDQVCKDDPRVTPLGLFLRRTSLDEFPQFINVLQGRMSIVGPRPHPIALNDLYCDQVERYMWRHKVKPGITGWAQVNGFRGETDTLEKMRKRVEYDLYYIDHWSLWFDIKIILMTMLRGFTDRNAY